MTRLWPGLLALALASAAAAQEGEPPPPSRPGSSPGELFRGIGSGLSGFFKGKGADRTLLQDIKPGPYAPSNQAIGEERDVESKRVAGLGLVPLREFQAYATGLYRKLQSLSGVEGLPGAVYVLAKSDLEASSTADGNVFLSIGWVRSLETEDELVALLAHELAHVLLRHHDSTIFASLQKQGQSLFRTGAGLKNQLETQAAGATVQASVALTPDQQKAVKRMEILIDVTEGAVLPAWTRKQENEADRLGFDLLVKAGYSPLGMNHLLERIASWEAAQAQTRQARQQEVQIQLDTLVTSGKVADAAKKGLMDAVSEFKIDLGKGHDGADKRAADLTEYTDKHHASAPLPALRKGEYQKLLAAREVKAVLDGYGRVFEGVEQLRSGRYADAEKLLADTLKPASAIQSHAQPNYQMYLALTALGRTNDAQKHLQRSFLAPEPAWKPFETAIRQVGRRGDRTGALAISTQAQRQFKQAPALLPELVGVYTELRYADEAKNALATCELQHPTYRDLCRERGKPR